MLLPTSWLPFSLCISTPLLLLFAVFCISALKSHSWHVISSHWDSPWNPKHMVYQYFTICGQASFWQGQRQRPFPLPSHAKLHRCSVFIFFFSLTASLTWPSVVLIWFLQPGSRIFKLVRWHCFLGKDFLSVCYNICVNNMATICLFMLGFMRVLVLKSIKVVIHNTWSTNTLQYVGRHPFGKVRDRGHIILALSKNKVYKR